MQDYDTIARAGYICETDFEKHSARVEFPDLGITSAWLPVLITNTYSNKDKAMPAVGEHVCVLLMENTGFIIGAFYDEKNPPQDTEEKTRSAVFEDGTSFTYNAEENEFHIKDCSGNEVIMKPDSVDIISASAINIKASGDIAVSADGGITVDASGDIEITAGGNVKIKGAKIDLN